MFKTLSQNSDFFCMANKQTNKQTYFLFLI